MDRNREQLLDILFDWTAVDLERLASTGAPPRANAEEVLRNLVHACAQEPEAFELFERLVRAERVEINRGRWSDVRL
jgi:hypothetical protein